MLGELIPILGGISLLDVNVGKPAPVSLPTPAPTAVTPTISTQTVFLFHQVMPPEEVEAAGETEEDFLESIPPTHLNTQPLAPLAPLIAAGPAQVLAPLTQILQAPPQIPTQAPNQAPTHTPVQVQAPAVVAQETEAELPQVTLTPLPASPGVTLLNEFLPRLFSLRRLSVSASLPANNREETLDGDELLYGLVTRGPRGIMAKDLSVLNLKG